MHKTDENPKAALKRQLKQILQETKIPTLPMVAQKLVNLCKEDMASFVDFAEIIRLDPGLGIQLLRIANSAYYGQLEPVTTLQKCIQILGLKYVKTIALGFQLANTLHKFSGDSSNMKIFWQKSVLRGVIARQIARIYVPARSEEAFLIGLLQDCGIIILARALGEKYTQLWTESQDSHSSLLEKEQNAFDFDHVQAASIMMEQWLLPATLAQPIQMHHSHMKAIPEPDETNKLSQIAYFTGTLSLSQSDTITEEDLKLPAYCQTVFGLDQQGMSRILEESQKEFSTISQLFKNILPQTTNAEELLAQAKNLLCELALDACQKVSDLEMEVARLHNSCQTLTGSLERILTKVETDNLTGLVQQGFLERYLETACELVQKGQMELTVFFIDIDNFKNINSQYGHVAGDQVLQTLASAIKEYFPKNSCLARAGGDEMVAAIFGVRLKESLSQASGLIQMIRELEISTRANDRAETIHFTCSIGMLFCEPGSNPGSASRILELSDHQMYQAKNNGKDSFEFQVLSANTVVNQNNCI